MNASSAKLLHYATPIQHKVMAIGPSAHRVVVFETISIYINAVANYLSLYR